jgi:hypothetical protein
MTDDVNELVKDLPVRCRRCGSAQIHAEKRGLTKSRFTLNPLTRLRNSIIGQLSRGSISEVVITSLKCGYTFEPGKRS